MNLTTIAAYPGSGAGCASAVRAEAMRAALTRQADSIEAQVWEAAGYPAKPMSNAAYVDGPLGDPGHTHDLRGPGACHPAGIFGPPEAPGRDDGVDAFAYAHSIIRRRNFHQ